MRREKLYFVLGLVALLCLPGLPVPMAEQAAPVVWAAPYSDNALASSDASATVTFASARSSMTVVNDGANPVYVRAWSGAETPAAVTTATAGIVKINAGESVKIDWTSGMGGIGLIAYSHICGAGLTTTSRVWAVE